MSDKLTQELIDNLEDKIAIAKLEGKDAGELEKTLAIVRKKGVSNRKDMSLNEAIKAGLEKPELSTEGFTRPDVPLDSFNIPEKNIYTSPALKEAVKNSSPEFAQINKAVPKSVKLALLAGGAGLAGTAAMVNNFAKPDTQTPEQLADSIKNRDKLTTDSSGIGPSIFEKALEKNPNMEPFKIQKMLMDQGYSLEEMTKPTSLPKTTRIQDMFHYNPSAASTNGENVTSLSEVIKNGEEDRPEDIKKANKDLVSAVKAPGKLTLSGLNFSDPEYIERVKELREKEATAEQELKDAKTRTDWARVASILGEGLTRYAAARHGLDKGVDLSNLDLKTPDWGEMLKEDEAIYGRKAQQVNRDLALEKDLSNERRKAAEALIEKANRENIANWEQANYAYNKYQDRIAREKEVNKELDARKELAGLQAEARKKETKPEVVLTPKDKLKIHSDLVGAVSGLTRGDKPAEDKVREYANMLGIPENEIEELVKESSGEGIFNRAEPDKVNSILRKYAPSNQGTTSTQSTFNTPTQEQINQYTKAYGITPDKAREILTRRLNK